jgi:uncharacterized OB-fold protein
LTAEYAKPLPLRTEENAPFFDYLNAGELRLQRCGACGAWRYPPAHSCPECLTEGGDWTAVSGTGSVYSFIVVHQRYDAAFADDIPYNVAVVELDEGPRLVTNLVGCENSDLRVGMRVRAELVRVTEDVTLAKFRPL